MMHLLNNRGRGHPLNPGVRFGYLSSKGYFMKNVGSVKDYRSARQVRRAWLFWTVQLPNSCVVCAP